MKLLATLLTVLAVISLSKAAPAPNDIETALEQFLQKEAEQQQDDYDIDSTGGNEDAEMQMWLRNFFNKFLTNTGRNFCNQISQNPQQAVQALIQAFDEKAEMMQGDGNDYGTDGSDEVKLQFVRRIFRGVRRFFNQQGRNFLTTVGNSLCRNRNQPTTTTTPTTGAGNDESMFSSLMLAESQANDDTSEAQFFGSILRRVGGRLVGRFIRRRVCNMRDARRQEEAVAQYLDNAVNAMQDDDDDEEGQAQFFRRLWRRFRGRIVNGVRNRVCGRPRAETQSQDTQANSKALQDLLQILSDGVQTG